MDVDEGLDVYPDAVRQEMAKMARAKPVEPAEESLGDYSQMPSLDDLSHFPMPGDPYVPYSRPENKPQHKLCLLFRGIGYRLLDYNNLDSAEFRAGEAGESPILSLLFGGLRPTEYVLVGRDLRPLGALIRQHRIAWLREHPTGTVPKDCGKMVIARIIPRPLEI